MGDGDADHDFGWTAEESEILRQAIADSELLSSAESVRAYLREMRDQKPADEMGAGSDLVRAYELLVFEEAKKRTGAGVAFLDLVMAGRAGLQRAAEKYDPASGYPFDAYARWWIRRALEI